MDFQINLNFSVDRVESETDVDFMVRTFTEAILGARSTAVPLIRPNRYHPTLTFQIRSFKAQKKGRRHAWQSTKIRTTGMNLKFSTILFGIWMAACKIFLFATNYMPLGCVIDSSGV
jgi:hypothetical protein